jgi:hypothetical protein
MLFEIGRVTLENLTSVDHKQSIFFCEDVFFSTLNLGRRDAAL